MYGAAVTRTQDRQGTTSSPALMLAMATIGFAVNFWAWALISPLGPLFRDTGTLGSLTESDVALLVAVPVIVGSLGRIVVGALTDKFGGRVMFPLVSAATIVPILFIAFFALDSYTLLLVGGFFLGIGGTAFAVGVPFVNAWFPPERRGLAIGIFGAGMGGTAISALTTVKLFDNVGAKAPFLITAAVLAVYAVVAWLVLRDAPGRTVPTTSLLTRLAANARLPITWQACLLYAVAFGGYVAFSVYLPAYLKTAYGLDPGGRGEPDGRVRRGRGHHATRRWLALGQVRRRAGARRPGSPSWWSAPASRPHHRSSSRSARSPSSRWRPRWARAAAPPSR